MPFDVNQGIEVPDTDEPGTPRTIHAITLAGLAPLTGSEADIAVASEIRAAKLMEADDLLSNLHGNEAITEDHTVGALPVPHTTHTQVQHMQAAVNKLRHQTEAGWWIAHQTTTAQTLLEAFLPLTDITQDS